MPKSRVLIDEETLNEAIKELGDWAFVRGTRYGDSASARKIRALIKQMDKQRMAGK
jgi:hypothetical protein